MPVIDRRLFLVGSAALAMSVTRARPSRATPLSSGVEVWPGLVVQPRSSWAGDEHPSGPLEAEDDVRFLLVHHTASASDYGIDEVPDIIRQTYRFHTGPDKGWSDICYNFFVDRYGVVWEARAGSLAGPVRVDATGGSQGFAQLVCLIGDFTAVMPTEAALVSLTKMLAWMGQTNAVDVSPAASTTFVSKGSNRWAPGTSVSTTTIAGHRDMSATACPGDTFYPLVHDGLAGLVVAERDRWIQGPPPVPSPSTMPAATIPPTTTVATPPTTTLATSSTSTASSTSTTSGVSTTSAAASTSDPVSDPALSTSPAPATSAPGGTLPAAPVRPDSGSTSGSTSTSAAADGEAGAARPVVATVAVASIAAGAAALVVRRRRRDVHVDDDGAAPT